MIKKWFKRMILSLLYDQEIRKEITEAVNYQNSIPPPPPRPNKYSSPSS